MTLDSGQVRSGHDLRGTLTVHNTASTPVLLVGSRTKIARSSTSTEPSPGPSPDPYAAPGIRRPLDPGSATDLWVVGGTAGTDSYATAPGRYRVIAPLDVAQLDGTGARRLLSPATPLLVVG